MSRFPGRSPRRRRLLPTVLAVGAVGVAAPSAHATDFYSPPDPLPAGAPGSVIRSEPAALKLFGLSATYWTRAWRVMYRTTAADGSAVAVTGLLVKPRTGDDTKRPVIALGHGSEGLGDQCAPSRQFTRGPALETGTMYTLLKRGYAVMLADGHGFGTPGLPQYIVGSQAGKALLDGARAARQVQAANLPSSGKTGVFGFSEGGNTAVWAAELQPSYAPDVPLSGVVAGGTPADLAAVTSNLDGSLFAAFLFAGAVGLDAAYPELDLDQYLNAAGRNALASAQTLCTPELLPRFAFKRISDFTTSNPLEQPDWQAKIALNRAGRRTPTAPVYLFHGTNDEILPFGQAKTLRDEYCAQGADVRFVTSPQGHFQTYALGAPAAYAWLGARLQGTPDAGNCGT